MADEGNESGSKPASFTDKVAAATTAGNCVMTPVSLVSGTIAAPLGLVAGASGICSSGYVMKQGFILKNSASIVDLNSQLKQQSNKMAAENKKLKKKVAKLEETANRLKEVEEGLATMADQQGTDVNRLMQLVEENGKAIDEMKILMKGKICQNIISIMLKCDDGDFRLDEKEIEVLCLRLDNIDGVIFHEEIMRKLINDQNGSLMAVVGVVKAMLNDDPNAPKVFTFENDDSDDEG